MDSRERGHMPPEAANEAQDAEEATKKEQQRIEDEQAAHWMAQIAKEEAAEPKPEPTEKERAVAEAEALLEKWTEAETLAQLNALIEEKEAMESPLRKEAKDALAALTKAKKLLEPDGKWTSELEARRTRLGNAVGMINRGKVDHTRG